MFLYRPGLGARRGTFEGVIHNLERRWKETGNDFGREEIAACMQEIPCPVCKGKRLKKEVLAVTVGGLNIMELTERSITACYDFFEHLTLTEQERLIGARIIKEIKERLMFLKNVGLEYLTLSRSAGTLSGGESQRIRLATQIGSFLMGVLYILDEPSIGLHQRDNDKLIATLKQLRDLGNTVIVSAICSTQPNIFPASGKVRREKHCRRLTAIPATNRRFCRCRELTEGQKS